MEDNCCQDFKDMSPSEKSVESEDNGSGSETRLLPVKDSYCWECHKNGVDISCKACLRSYHQKCAKRDTKERELCHECQDIVRAEETEADTTNGCEQWLQRRDQLSELLKYTILTVKTGDRNQSFAKAVNNKEFPEYRGLIVNPMDLSKIERNVKKKTYASTNSFLADIKWIYHNCVVFNSGVNLALISEAKNVIRIAKQECEEIEICCDCYYNYYTKEEDNYFAAPCRRPHAIVWAKLKGHPYWPAKVVRFSPERHEVDVRFFGTHDKCWLKPDKCFLMSRNYPNNKKPSKFDQNKFDEAVRDMNSHLDLLDKQCKGWFRFEDKHTMFTVARLYLSPPSLMVSESEKEPKVLTITSNNSYNGIPFKNLTVRPTQFDVSSHLDHKSSPIKRQKCFSSSVAVRQELSSSFDSKMDSEVSFNRINNSTNGFDENDSHLENQTKVNTTSPETSDKTSGQKSVHKSFQKTVSNEENLKQRLKSLEFKIRKLEEEKNESNMKINALEDENKSQKRSIAELEEQIGETKRKQWCTNCQNEAILPCCWNTCYCTVECQHNHWPIHSKTCRRKQQKN